MTNTDFSTLPLSPALLDNLASLNFTRMTPIQAQGLPLVLAGKDVIAQASTGSGKTLAFGLGLLMRLNTQHNRVQAMVLCPTRELADQVARELRKLARTMQNVKLVALCGGSPTSAQTATLQFGAHIVVGTPGRILKHLQQETLTLDALNTLVLDEADRMLDMGFAEDIQKVVAFAPKERQTLLFSATYPTEINELSRGLQNQPASISVADEQNGGNIVELLFEVTPEQRKTALSTLLAHYAPASAVVFCNTKRACQEVADHLNSQGFAALALNGDLEQRERDQVLVRFANGSANILVATDVAARGLDIHELEAVINYEVTQDPQVHVHRIGRTGRAGHQGLALSLYSAKEAYRVNMIEEYQRTPMAHGDLSSLDAAALPRSPDMVTLNIAGGRKTKIRAGDILGALTRDAGINGEQVGKIDITDMQSYVAIHKDVARQALKHLQQGKIKGRSVRVSRLG
ncbi:ATP-dependent RNA helicase DbpA [Oceanimonas baumannii]|uniref:ATP-dependent RNA helicase DbpA n=1 Tax=Oceanimonas baumannii TaxID=129578 RepID=A0A235CNJ7_9GAMM|nr:ATP-dependent RNA helicase DbpA [Oceanimonas baumannii]OYD26143.1 ATP-dependent RNA helicase DbpA [Oceanimonas baumannii]TDW62209.1 ATP-independent RNA helicase DbpA [Oceanimonas baumannii]